MHRARFVLLWTLAAASPLPAQPSGTWRSHPPMRPLPAASPRPLDNGPAYFVDPAKGDDGGDGTRDKPFRTVAHAVKRLKAGDTLYLRGGTYYEHVTVNVSGSAERPVTIRAYPNELVVLDGGLREFHDEPATAWEPSPGGAAGEFRSRKTYPGLGSIAGNFADSMVPLHAYKFLVDLRTTNEYWNLKNNQDTDSGIYCGPGIWYDAGTGHIHIRLAHTKLACLGADNYRGEGDPRKLRLVIGGARVPLRLDQCKHVRILDLVVRGGSRSTIHIADAEDIVLDGVTAYGGDPALMVSGTRGLKVLRCAFHGIAAPWSFRTHHKYRGVAAYLLVVRGDGKPTRDLEIAWSDLTDSHDGPFLGTVKGLKFHHNRVDNFNDDGVYLTAMEVGGDVHICENHLSRCLHVFAFFGKYQTGSGVWIYRNVIDLRPPVHYFPPGNADDPRFAKGEVPARGRLCGDHGSPIWEPINFYHNTVLTSEPAFRGFYAAGWGGHTGRSKRAVFNNIFLQTDAQPGLNFSSADDVFQSDGNLHWSVKDGPAFKGDFFAGLRNSKLFAASKKHYAPGWAAGDRFADPRLVQFEPDWRAPLDARLKLGSPALDAGVPLPAEWRDPLRAADAAAPDIGALPLGAEPFRAGRPRPNAPRKQGPQ